MKKTVEPIDYREIKTKDNTKKFHFGELVRLELDESHYYFLFTKENPKGKHVISVTHILGDAGPVDYGLRHFWQTNTKEAAEEIFNATSARGSKLHAAAEALVGGVKLNLKEDYKTAYEKKAIISFLRWFRIAKPTEIMSEATVVSKQFEIAGTLDFYGKMTRRNAELALNPTKYFNFDEKTGKLSLKKDPKSKEYLIAKAKIEDPDKVESWIIDYKFTSGIRYSAHKQVLAYKALFEESFGLPVDRVGIFRGGTTHKHGYEFAEVKGNFNSFLNIYYTFLDMNDGKIPPPQLVERFPDEVKLFEEEVKDEKGTV